MSETYMVITLVLSVAWLFMCISIGVSNPKNQWGPCAVQNYCDINDDRRKIMNWFFIGVIGMAVILLIGVFLSHGGLV